MWWANEVHEMSRIIRIPLFVELSAVITESKQMKSSSEGNRATRETTRLASQARQIMSQFRIICFYRIRVSLALGDFISAKVIPKTSIGIKSITVIPFRFWRFIHHLLNDCLGAFPDDCPTQQTTGFAVYNCKNVDSVFLSPIKVNNSSSSASFTSGGMGAFGKACAWSTTQRATVRW